VPSEKDVVLPSCVVCLFLTMAVPPGRKARSAGRLGQQCSKGRVSSPATAARLLRTPHHRREHLFTRVGRRGDVQVPRGLYAST